jgi:hypothetical protein
MKAAIMGYFGNAKTCFLLVLIENWLIAVGTLFIFGRKFYAILPQLISYFFG